ncbi:MAG: anti-sigma F factor antagonist [Caldicoprobacterales bacterium]|nr:anti-sigma F factor antagonist [Clostridiales bacterium]
MEIKGRKKKNTLMVSLKGELDHHTANQVRQYIDGILEDPTIKNIVMDIQGLNFMDSSGIGVILGRYKIISKRGGKLGVVNINAHIDRIFQMSGIYKLIKVYDQLDQALNDMGGY